MARSKSHKGDHRSGIKNYFAVLDEDDTSDLENVPNRAPVVNTKESLKLPPITVLEKSCDNIHKMCNSAAVKDYKVKKVSIGTKIFCESQSSYKCIMDALIDNKWQFFSHEIKSDTPFKAVMRGLDGVSADFVKHEITKHGLNCCEVKKIVKSFNHGSETLFIISFAKNSVKLVELKSKIPAISHTIVRWDYHKKSKNSFVQCRNCQMFGHGEKSCSVDTKCFQCGGGHKSALCEITEPSKLVCANCKGNHKANDLSCPSRASYAQIRERLQWRFRRNNNVQSKEFDPSRSSFPPLHSRTARAPLHNMSAIHKPNAWSVPLSFGTNNNNTNLFSTNEILELTIDMMSKLQSCTSKQQQFNVITELVVKYLYSI